MKENNPEELHFYYSREKRLAKAPESVVRLYDPRYGARRGLLQSLTGTKSQAFLLLAIIMLVVTALVMSWFMKQDEIRDLDGNRYTVEAFSFNEMTYVAVKKHALSKDAYQGPLGIAVALPGSEDIFTEHVTIRNRQDEEFRFSVPIKAAHLIVLIKADDRYVRFFVQVR
ncbi:MAG: hypothetical protein SNJ56_03100 [Termitinemataceae bacterium]